MRFLRKNTAVIVTVGPFYDKGDGVTIETGLTITNERITLTADTDDGSAPTNILDNIAGATSGTANDLNYITGNDAGMMQLELAAADTNRLGRMFLSITDAANHVPVFHEFMVMNQVLFDSFYSTTAGAIPLVAAAGVGGLLTAPTTANTGLADVTRILGTAAAAPATAGILEVNVKNFNNLAAVALPLVPTTAGRTLDVSAAGEAGIDWANIGSPTTAQDLSATNIDVDQVVASVSGAVGSVAGAVGSVTGNVGGNVVGSVASVTAGVTLAASAVQAIWDALTSALTTAGSIGKKLADWVIGTTQTGDSFARLGAPAGASVSADIAAVKADTAAILVDTGTTLDGKLPAALVGGRMDSSVGAVAAGAITAAAIATGAVDADALAADAVAEIADGVWDEGIAGHLGAGSTGAALNAAGGAGDPWTTSLPGAYGAGTAGFIIGTNLDAPVSAVQTDTDNIQTRLPAALVGGRIDASVGAVAANAITAASIATGAIDADAIAADAANEIADALLDRADAIEVGLTLRQAMRVEAAAAGGKLSGAATATVTIRNAQADSKDRIVASVDANGNRSAVTLDLST